MLPSDEDEIDEEDLEAINCFPGFFPVPVPASKIKGEINSWFGSVVIHCILVRSYCTFRLENEWCVNIVVQKGKLKLVYTAIYLRH